MLTVRFVKTRPEGIRVVSDASEVSPATAGTENLFMSRCSVPAGSQGMPHYHEDCESAVYMLSGRLNVRWGDDLQHAASLGPGDMIYVPPRETHLLENPSMEQPAEYVVARDAPDEHSVDVPWAT